MELNRFTVNFIRYVNFAIIGHYVEPKQRQNKDL